MAPELSIKREHNRLGAWVRTCPPSYHHESGPAVEASRQGRVSSAAQAASSAASRGAGVFWSSRPRPGGTGQSRKLG